MLLEENCMSSTSRVVYAFIRTTYRPSSSPCFNLFFLCLFYAMSTTSAASDCWLFRYWLLTIILTACVVSDYNGRYLCEAILAICAYCPLCVVFVLRKCRISPFKKWGNAISDATTGVRKTLADHDKKIFNEWNNVYLWFLPVCDIFYRCTSATASDECLPLTTFFFFFF